MDKYTSNLYRTINRKPRAIYLGITDTKWVNFIKEKHEGNILNEYINFWLPGNRNFKQLQAGDIFMFKLHNNINRGEERGEIVGGAYFNRFEKLSLNEAWKQFGNGNGAESIQEMEASIKKYRERNGMALTDDIGCIILEKPFFLNKYLEEPLFWKKSLVQGKKYDADSAEGQSLLQQLSDYLDVNSKNDNFADSIEKELSSLGILGEERLAYIKVRVNQSVFREHLLRRYEHCCLCNVSDNALLRASHIKPWSESNANEKLDVDNGLILCPNHDVLFDQGFISFNDEGKILISDRLSENDRMFMNVNPNMEIKLTEGNKEYMDYHRKKIFKK